MIALEQQNYLYIDIPSFSDSSFIKTINQYITTFQKLNQTRKFLKSIFHNFDTFVIINSLNSSEKIDHFLETLEDITDINEDILENNIFSQWHTYPLYYLVDKIEDWNMATQGLLTGLDARLKHQVKYPNDN